MTDTPEQTAHDLISRWSVASRAVSRLANESNSHPDSPTLEAGEFTIAHRPYDEIMTELTHRYRLQCQVEDDMLAHARRGFGKRIT